MEESLPEGFDSGDEPLAWETLDTKIVFNHKFMQIREDKVRLPNGDVWDDYTVWNAPDIAVVPPVLEDGRFVVVRQYRHARQKILYQFPAGMVDKGETAEQAARREAEEEAGCVGGTISDLGFVSLFGTKMTSVDELFLLQGVRFGGKLDRHPSERTAIELKTRAEVQELINNGSMESAGAQLAFLKALVLLDQES